MAANAALRIGAGLVSCAIPESINTAFASSAASAMSIPLPDENGVISYDAIRELPFLLDKKNGSCNRSRTVKRSERKDQ